jgi:hypothetical protein
MEKRNATDLLRIDPKRRADYSAFALVYLTAYSVHWLTVWEIPTTYENVSVANARFFPTQFSLPGFPQFPDAMRTNRTLLQMRPKYRGFATSDPRKGVFLSEKGRAAALKVLEVVGLPSFEGTVVAAEVVPDVHQGAGGRERTRNPSQIVAESKSKLLFRRYKEGRFEETEIVHLLGLVSLYDHTPASEIRKALRQLRADAQIANDREFLEFLDRVEERFSVYLNRDHTT